MAASDEEGTKEFQVTVEETEADVIERVIQKAREGDWRSATRVLWLAADYLEDVKPPRVMPDCLREYLRTGFRAVSRWSHTPGNSPKAPISADKAFHLDSRPGHRLPVPPTVSDWIADSFAWDVLSVMREEQQLESDDPAGYQEKRDRARQMKEPDPAGVTAAVKRTCTAWSISKNTGWEHWKRSRAKRGEGAFCFSPAAREFIERRSTPRK